MNTEEAVEELFSRTRWATERRLGVEHYRTGQVKVREVDPEEGERHFMLAYTPADGHGICAFICTRRAAWEIVDNVRIRVDGIGFRVQQIDGYILSKTMIEALDQALSEGE